ncbi:MAG: TfoX/Sxy family protein [Nocardioides sp.]
MAYDEELAARLRDHLEGEPGLAEKKMFGGLAFLIGGHMAVAAASQGGLLLRCDPADTDAHVTDPHAERFVMRSKAMDGWLRIDPAGLATDEALAGWADIGAAYARGLPPK